MIHSWPDMEHVKIRDEGSFGHKVPECLEYVTFVLLQTDETYGSQDLAIDAVSTISVDLGNGQHEVDIKKYSKVEKIPGGRLEDSKVLQGVMFNKDVVSPGKMRRRILNPRIVLLDSPLEYKKGENMTNAELMKEDDWYDTEHYNSDHFGLSLISQEHCHKVMC